MHFSKKVCLILLAYVHVTIADILVQPTTPSGVYPDQNSRPPFIEAKVTSEFEVQSVTAQLLDQVLDLAFSGLDSWRTLETFDLKKPARGTNVILFTATDIFGNKGNASVSIVIDFPPSLAVQSPLSLALARPLLHVMARATDDREIPEILVMDVQGRGYIREQTNKIDLTIDLSSFEGTVTPVSFFAYEQSGAHGATSLSPRVLSLSNPRYQPLELVPGLIRDANSNAVLFATPEGALEKLDRTSGRRMVITNDFNGADSTRFARLTATGVLFHDRCGAGARLIDLNEGQYIDLGEGFQNAVLKGRFGVLQRPARSGKLSVLRDFVARTNIDLPIEVWNSADVGENGAVVFNSALYPLDQWAMREGNAVYLYQQNHLTLISQSTNQLHDFVQTDGTNAVWMTVPDSFVVPFTYRIHAYTPPTGFIELNTNLPAVASQPISALVVNGWIAFPKLGPQGQQQIWLRSPDGAIRQGTFYSDDAGLRALRGDGSIIASLGKGYNPSQIIYAAPNKIPRVLNSDFGANYFFEGDQLSATFGTTYFAVQPEGDLIGLSSPQTSANGQFSAYVTSTTPASFVLERSGDLINWTLVGNDSVTNTTPKRIEIQAAPGFLRVRKE